MREMDLRNRVRITTSDLDWTPKQQFPLRDLTVDLCFSRTMPPASTPRSLDLAHLRTAVWFHEQEPLTRFVSLDEAQSATARELGLPV